jgi:hypothetical protein
VKTIDSYLFDDLERLGRLNPAWEKLPNWRTIDTATRKILFVTALNVDWDNNDGREDAVSPLFKTLGSDQVMNCLREIKKIVDADVDTDVTRSNTGLAREAGSEFVAWAITDSLDAMIKSYVTGGVAGAVVIKIMRNVLNAAAQSVREAENKVMNGVDSSKPTN